MITYSEFKASIAYLLEQDLEGWFPNGHATWTWCEHGDDILVCMAGYLKIKHTILDSCVQCTEYHVCYSPIYQNPVLYMISYDQHGNPINMLDDPDGILQHAIRDHQVTVSQESHPSTHQPCLYQLHPCNTDDIIASIVSDDHGDTGVARYMLAWMSAVQCGLAPTAAVASRLLSE
ncbi:Ubiquitin-like-conjugating enzyme ATG10 [Picochlorum sp. SENEW3]|nr:Ubiquitin-like-conjugating enzyme ATG10 [Picochlorum sp. SENEW3]